ncbi:MAG: selenocysteine-specific translation elongation factor [Chloroflexi bacterium]|nr:selenocysteine-specific translation elongation factor [Chloroflexota bacterium]
MYVIGTAGHVDHGKSLLVEALTGIDPDRLREEKARGMTIDLGFAWLTLPGGRSVSIVDVPGHERFIKNMLAGAGGIDLALLVVAADDGVMPQTREHLAILDLLDVRRGVVALTKRDLVDDDWQAMVAADIEETLAGTTLAGSPIVPCSALTSAGLDDLLRALGAAVEGLPPKRDIGRPRLPIDRAFTIDGFGTVVTGTLIDGELATGDEVELVPGGMRGRVRGLQTHRDKVERAQPGTRTAVNVSGIAKDDVRRGLVLSRPGAVRATDVLDVHLRALAGLRHPLRHNMAVTFHCYADEANALVRLLENDELRPGETAWAQIKLDAPVAALRGDRFVLRTPNDTVAGGVIADTAPRRHRRGDRAVLDSLEVLLSGVSDVIYEAVTRRPLTDAPSLAASLAITREDADAALSELAADGRIIVTGDGEGARVMTAEYLRRMVSAAAEMLGAYHAQHPLRPGMPQEELRTRLGIDGPAFAQVAGLLPAVRITGGTAARAGFAPAPTAEQQARIDRYLAALRAPSADVAGGERLEPELLAYLVDTGRIIDAGDGVHVEAEAFEEIVRQVRAHIEQHGAVTLAQARDLLGTSRRQAQALLEQMDRMRITRRTGDERVLRL